MADPKFFDSQWLQIRDAGARAELLSSRSKGVRPTVLILDDEDDHRLSLKELFESYGLTVIETADHDRAERSLVSTKNDLVLVVCDQKMPKMTGLEWRARSLSLNPEIPFVILSGWVDRDMAVQGMALRIHAFWEKPLKQSEFLSLMETHVDTYLERLKDERELLHSFLDDADSIVEQTESLFLELELEPQNRELLNQAYGLLHTMKGNSGFFEPRTLHEFTHRFEDEIKKIQNGSVQLDAQVLGVWLKALDIQRNLIAEFRQGQHSALTAEVLAGIFDEKLESSGSATLADPNGKEAPSGPKKKKDAEVKVSMKLLDEFMQISGELTVIRNMINKTAQTLERRYSADKDVQMLQEFLYEMHKINSDVQGKINDLRRVSIQSLLRPLMRTARDTARTLEKEIELKIEGGSVRVDHSIAEALSHSLIHLIRNSLDHGIERPKDRELAGKSAKGSLSLTFRINGDWVEAEVRDDGRGLNTARIKQKCLEQGLKSASELERMSSAELHSMIFEAGFSTAQATTQFSGRGVGMSMVKDSVEQLGGEIKIESTEGRGSCFGLRIPVPKSALIEPCLFVSVGERTYALPQESILRVIQPQNSTDTQEFFVQSARFALIQAQLVPIVCLETEHKAVLEAGAYERDRKSQGPVGKVWILLKSEQGNFVLEVETIHDVEDSVIKAFQLASLKALGIFKGGTYLADATVALVLDVNGLAQSKGVRAVLEKVRAQESGVLPDSAHKPLDLIEGRYISFCLDSERSALRPYVIPERFVLRIQQMALSELQWSGGGCFALHSDHLMPLIDLKKSFEEQSLSNFVSSEKEQGPVLALVIQGSEGPVALVVQDVHDLEYISGKACEGSGEVHPWVEVHLVRDSDSAVFALLDVKILQNLICKAPKAEIQKIETSRAA